MKRQIFAGALGVAAALVLVFGSIAGANVVVPGTATVDCSAAHISLKDFTPGDHVVTATGTVGTSASIWTDTTAWTAHATLHGTSGRLTFQIPDSLTADTERHHVTFDTVSWPGHPTVHLANVSVTKRCHEVTTTTTKSTTSTTKPMTTTTTGHTSVTTTATPPSSGSPPSDSGTLPFTGRDNSPLMLGALGAIAIGVLLILRAREMQGKA